MTKIMDIVFNASFWSKSKFATFKKFLKHQETSHEKITFLIGENTHSFHFTFLSIVLYIFFFFISSSSYYYYYLPMILFDEISYKADLRLNNTDVKKYIHSNNSKHLYIYLTVLPSQPINDVNWDCSVT